MKSNLKTEMIKLLDWLDYNTSGESNTETVDNYFKETYNQALTIHTVVLQSEQLQAIEDLKDLAYDTCPLDRRDDLSEIVGRL